MSKTFAAVALLLASVSTCGAQVLDPPPSVGWTIEWRADLYGRNFTMLGVPIDAITGTLDEPTFPTRRTCEARGYRETPKMVNFITAYMEADGSVRWECRSAPSSGE
jgi:hypothetical protein